MRDWFQVEAAAKGGGGEILIYSHIGKQWSDDTDAVDAKQFVEALGKLTKGKGDIHVRINSPGGDVGAGMAIYNALRKVKDRVVCTVEGVAYSMASIVALAGRETRMAETGQFMVHNPSTMAYGGAKDLKQALGALETARAVLVKAYATKTGKTAEAIGELMDDTTFMTADEAKDFGFVDTIVDGDDVIEEGRMAACFDVTAWHDFYTQNNPELMPELGDVSPAALEVEDGGGTPETETGTAPERDNHMLKISEIRAACPGADSDFITAQVEASEGNEKLTIGDVQTAFIAAQADALKASQDATATAQAEAEKAKAEAVKAADEGADQDGLGVNGLSGDIDGEGGIENPIEAWEDAVAEKVKLGIPKAKAIRAVAVSNSALHASYLEAYNAQHGRSV